MNGGDIRPDRHALLESDALLTQIESLVAEGDRARFDGDRYRWVLHRLWIAVGNEAIAYIRLAGRLYRLRNMLAHDRLPDIDEDEVWRMTTIRPAQLRVRGAWLLLKLRIHADNIARR